MAVSNIIARMCMTPFDHVVSEKWRNGDNMVVSISSDRWFITF